MKLKEAVAKFEAMFEKVRVGRAAAFCETGEPYVCIAGAGVRPEGTMTRVFCTTPEDAVRVWLFGAMDYATGKGPDLYWREKPELDETTFFEDAAFELGKKPPHYVPIKMYRVYSRMLVTTKEAKVAA